MALAWTAPTNNDGSAVTGYNVYEGTSPGTENYASPVNGGTLITTTSTSVTGLTNATSYYFTVKAVNAVGPSTPSNEAWAIPAATVPGAPTHVAAVGSDGSASVSWDAPSDQGGSNITSYTVSATDSTVASRGGQTCTWASGPLDCTVLGLSNGDSYTFTVSATNSLGTGAASAASNAVIPAVSAPSAPTAVTVTPGNGSVALSWTAPFDGGASITGYNLYEATTSGGENYTTPVNGGTLLRGTSTTVNSLTNGTKYYFTIKAVNSVGSSPASVEVWAIPGGTAPGAPTTVAATAGFASAVVTWNAPSDLGGSAVTRYTATATDSSVPARGGQSCTWTSGPLTCTVTGLSNGDSYTFVVTATNSVGTGSASAPSNAVVPALSSPSAPTGLTAVPGNGKVVLSWTTPTNGGADITGYNIYSASSPGAENYGAPANGSVLVEGDTGTISGLVNGHTYYFTVKAVNDVGSSAPSNEVWAIPAVTVSGPPQDVTSSAGTNGSATVSWLPPIDRGGSAISGYVVTPFLGTTAQASVVFHDTTTTQILSGLEPGAAYSFEVAAINASGNGKQSAASNVIDVPRAYTILSLSLSGATVVYGDEQAEQFAVSVAPNYPGPVPTGTVTIKKSTTTLCVITLSSAKGSCSLTAAELPVRSFSVYAIYARNTSFVGSSSFKTKTVLTVTRAASLTRLTVSSPKATFGHEQLERLSVSVTSAFPGAAVSGAVTISGTPCIVKLSGGKGSCNLKARTLAAGKHSLVAHYWGSPYYVGSLSTGTTVDVTK